MSPRGGRRARQKHRAHQAQLRAGVGSWIGIWQGMCRARERRPDLQRPASQPGTVRREKAG